MGAVEGNTIIPPVNAEFLFKRTNRTLAIVDPRIPMGFNLPQSSYDEQSLAKSIRDGVKVGGTPMEWRFMPRYPLEEGDMRALTAYLRQLSSTVSAGVEEQKIRFATVITPEVDAPTRKVVIDGLKTYFITRNSQWRPGPRHHRTGFEVYPRTPRAWELAVWELEGEASTWPEQLRRHYQENPVFALISGLSTVPFQALDEFCNQQRVPCLFPTVDATPGQESRYSFYFSKGVVLEADILASHLRTKPGKKPPARVVQIVHDDEIGRLAAQSLEASLKVQPAIKTETRLLPDNRVESLKKALAGLKAEDVVMCWWRNGDYEHLQKIKPPPARGLYFSTFMGRGENAPLPQAWKDRAELVYPYEKIDKRVSQLVSFYSWVNTNGFPALSERIQSEVYFNLLLLSEATGQMLDNLYQEYLVERVEDILSMGFNRTIYPSVSLGPGQRFASKGGYVMRFQKGKLVAETELIIP